jgi:hypothetical protein
MSIKHAPPVVEASGLRHVAFLADDSVRAEDFFLNCADGRATVGGVFVDTIIVGDSHVVRVRDARTDLTFTEVLVCVLIPVELLDKVREHGTIIASDRRLHDMQPAVENGVRCWSMEENREGVTYTFRFEEYNVNTASGALQRSAEALLCNARQSAKVVLEHDFSNDPEASAITFVAVESAGSRSIRITTKHDFLDGDPATQVFTESVITFV